MTTSREEPLGWKRLSTMGTLKASPMKEPMLASMACSAKPLQKRSAMSWLPALPCVRLPSRDSHVEPFMELYAAPKSLIYRILKDFQADLEDFK